MRVKILHGSEIGQVQDHPDGDIWAENAVQTGYAELAPEPKPDVPDLDALTVAELEDVGDGYGIEAKHIEGTGARGRVVRADWLRVLTAHD